MGIDYNTTYDVAVASYANNELQVLSSFGDGIRRMASFSCGQLARQIEVFTLTIVSTKDGEHSGERSCCLILLSEQCQKIRALCSVQHNLTEIL